MSFRLADFAARCGVADPEKFAGKCEDLRLHLEECNRFVNLTRITGAEDFAVKHAADSLTVVRACPGIVSEPMTVADVGCGAGFPSLILALAYPQLQITAIDSTGKKIAFVRQAAEKLRLTNLHAVCARAEELQKQSGFQRKFAIVTARAVAPSPKLFRETEMLAAPGGRWIFYKTPAQAAEEKAELQKFPRVSWEFTDPFPLPGNAGERLFVIGRSTSIREKIR